MRIRLAGMLLVAAVLLLASAPEAFAQGCALCRTAAEATGERGAKTLNLAILVLLIPTVSIFGGVLFCAFRYRNRSFLDQIETRNGGSSQRPFHRS